MSATPAPPPQPAARAALPGLIPFAEPVSQTASRKDDHLRIAAGDAALHGRGTGLDRYRLLHRALPGRDLDEVDLSSTLLGRPLDAPIVISAMTGGTRAAGVVNERLAAAAARYGVGLALGSGRALLRDRRLLSTYVGAVRPSLLIANIGAPQLLEPDGINEARRLVELLGADAIAVHCNPLQEAIQPEGQPEFRGLSERIGVLCATLDPVPVVVKEVGFGMSPADVRLLVDAGVHAIDVAGAGGTNWALIEGQRDPDAAAVSAAFRDWGVSTADALTSAVETADGRVDVIASGGLRDGVEGATCLALGASAVGFARELLLAAQADRADAAVDVLIRQLRIATWLTGAPSSDALRRTHLQGRPTTHAPIAALEGALR